MRNIALIALVALVVGCSPGPSSVPGPVSNFTGATIADFKDLSLGEPIQEGGLTLIPVSNSKPDLNIDDYVSLAEAKKNGWVEIIEVPDEANVESLKVHYTGPKPMLLLAGELLLGGKQDRVVAKDTVIKPGDTIDVMVYCVEPGRWDGNSMHFEPQASQVPLSTKEKAILRGQQEVWNDVGRYNRDAGVTMGAPVEGSSLRGGYGAMTATKEYEAALDNALKALRARKDVVGVVIVVDGKVHSFEYFGSSRLFASSAESVLRGALATSMLGKGSVTIPPMSEVADFVSRSLNSAKDMKRSGEDYDAFQTNSVGVAGGVATLPDSEGAVVHGTFYEKSKD